MRVLAVDDNPTDLKRIESALLSAGCQVVCASNGAQAIEFVTNNQPDAIFMDVNMPGTDGFAAARKLLGEDGTKHIPIVFVTSKDQKADKAWGQMLGAKGYITKPFTDEDVAAQVKAL